MLSLAQSLKIVTSKKTSLLAVWAALFSVATITNLYVVSTQGLAHDGSVMIVAAEHFSTVKVRATGSK
jgi:hypothetical protein